jgi:hypothetical protein
MPTSVQYPLERCRALQEKWLQVLHKEPPRDDHDDDDEDEEDEDEDEEEEEEVHAITRTVNRARTTERFDSKGC